MTAAEQQQAAENTAVENEATEEKAAAPFFQVVRGNPTAVEVGILAAVLATAQGNAVHQGEFPTGIKDDWGSYE
ncbi:acyl-CoA carboxylase subunit epsilon, partial [Dietzia sp. DQ11-44]|nr:acyl-CoA carboxylase subunit epsilon [Dietzia sp. DQ11-44]